MAKIKILPEDLSIEQKASQMVMVDFSGEDPDCEFAYSLRHQGWGGVIFFPKNLKNSAQTKRLVGALQNHF